MKYELEKFKNENTIQKKVFKKYENMIENRIKSQLQECQLAMRNEIQNSKIEFQKQKGFYLLDKFIENLRVKQEELLKLKNDPTLIKTHFEEIWKQIIDQQTKNINDIFEGFTLQLFKIITKEFSDCYLRSENENEFQIFFKQRLLKEPPSQSDFENIFNKFGTELLANQFVPIERSLKNRIFGELFYRDFDLKIQSQKRSYFLKLQDFYKEKIKVSFVNQKVIKEYLEQYFINDLKKFIKRQKEDVNANLPIGKLVNEFFSLLFCFGVHYDQAVIIKFTSTLENQSIFFNFLQSDEQDEQKFRQFFKNIFKFSAQPNLGQESEQYFNKINELYVSLKIQTQEFVINSEQISEPLYFARQQFDKNFIIIHVARQFQCFFSDDIYQKTFQYIQNQRLFHYYQNTFKCHISEIIQRKMQEKKNDKWKQLYLQIHNMVTEQMMKRDDYSQQNLSQNKNLSTNNQFQIPQYNSSRIRLIMQRIEIFIEEYNKQFSNFGIILNDIGQRCIYYFPLLIIWRLLCYGQWQIKSLHLRKLNDEPDVQFKKFEADILENQIEQSVLRGNALAIEVHNNFLKYFYLENSQKAQSFLSQYQETSSSLIKYLDQQILENSEPNVSDEQIMSYITNQSCYIEEIVNERIQKYTQDIQANFQQSFQQKTKKLLLEVQNNSKNLKELSINLMKAKDYFDNQNLQHEKILFQIVVQCLQGNNQIQDLNMIKEEHQDVFSLINPIKIDFSLIDQQRSTSDFQIQILNNFIAAFTDKIQDFISNCHKLQIDIRQLNIQNTLDELRLVQIGCLHSCPICKRKCDSDQYGQNHKHECQNGHQLRGMNKVLIKKNPSLFICEEINDETKLQIQETGIVKSWKQIKQIYNTWQFSCEQQELKLRQTKMTNIWNNIIGIKICKQLEKDLGISINYFPKLENQLQSNSYPYNIHFILILDSSESMEGERWQNVVNGVVQFMQKIENNDEAKITIILFDDQPICVVDFESLNIEQQKMKMYFKGGGILVIIIHTYKHDDIYVILFIIYYIILMLLFR